MVIDLRRYVTEGRLVLSNAERQARYRKRLQERARGGDLPAMVREVIEGALRAIWAHVQANNLADLDGYGSCDAFLDACRPRRSSDLGRAVVELCDLLGGYADDVPDAARAVAVLDAATLMGTPNAGA